MRTFLLAADPKKPASPRRLIASPRPACCARSGGALCWTIWHAKRSNSSMPDHVGWRAISSARIWSECSASAY